MHYDVIVISEKTLKTMSVSMHSDGFLNDLGLQKK